MKLQAFILLSAVLILTGSCRKSGCTDPLAVNYNEKVTDDDGSCLYYEALIENFSGTTDHGGSFLYEYNYDQSFFRWTNEITGEVQEGNYRDLGGSYEGVLELEIDNESIHTIKSPLGYTVGYFPNDEGTYSLAFGTSTEMDLQANSADLYGDYVYFFMSPEGVNGNPLWKEWGLMSFGTNNQLKLANLATGGEEDYPAIPPQMLDSIGLTLPVSSEWDSDPEAFRFDANNPERLLIDSESGDELSVYGSVSKDHGILVVDVPEEGMGIALRIDNYSINDVAGEYRTIDVDREGAALYGSVSFNSNGRMDYLYPVQGGQNDEGTIDGLIQVQSIIPNCFYKEDFGDDGEDIYLFFSGDCVLYIVFDEEGEFLSYGMGYRLES
jgi:hypothetical protein